MKCILTIGYTDILLPSTNGIESIIKTLSKGVEVQEQLYVKKVTIRRQAKVGLQIVPDDTKFVDEQDSEVSLDEVAPRDTHCRVTARLLNGRAQLPRLKG